MRKESFQHHLDGCLHGRDASGGAAEAQGQGHSLAQKRIHVGGVPHDQDQSQELQDGADPSTDHERAAGPP